MTIVIDIINVLEYLWKTATSTRRYHLAQERQRVHETRYADNDIPQAA